MMSELSSALAVIDSLGARTTDTKVICAVSGGLDSMCLLHLMTTYGKMQEIETVAAHFNHQLRGEESDRDEAFVKDWCRKHDVEFVCGRGDVRALAAEEKLTLEEAARKARYAFLEELQETLCCDAVLVAHNADDNAETMLLNLLRGTGLRGLTGIPATRDSIVRPLLRVTRQKLEEYAATHQIPYVEDSTNQENIAARNLLRHKVLPVLRELNPKAVENMGRTAELLARDEQALFAATESLGYQAWWRDHAAIMPAEKLREAARAVTSRYILAMMAHVCGQQKDLNHSHVDAVYALLWGEIGKEVSLPYGTHAFLEQGDYLVIRKRPAPLQDCVLRLGQGVRFGIWNVEFTKDGDGWEIALPMDAEVSVGAWRSGDRMTIPGSRGPRSLKRLFVDHGIEVILRERIPVLRVNGQAAAVPGIGIHTEFLPTPMRPGTAVIRFYQETEEKNDEK